MLLVQVHVVPVWKNVRRRERANIEENKSDRGTPHEPARVSIGDRFFAGNWHGRQLRALKAQTQAAIHSPFIMMPAMTYYNRVRCAGGQLDKESLLDREFTPSGPNLAELSSSRSFAALREIPSFGLGPPYCSVKAIRCVFTLPPPQLSPRACGAARPLALIAIASSSVPNAIRS